MSIKERMITRAERIYLQFRGMGAPMFLPILADYIILPLTIYVLAKSGDYRGAGDYAYTLAFLLLPMMSVWWLILVMEKCLEEEGELFFLYERGKWVDVLWYYLTYLLLILPLCQYFMNRWFDTFWLSDIAALLAQCFFSVCLVYLLCFMTKSVVISFVTVLAFTLYINGRLFTILEQFGLYQWVSSSGYLVTGIVCLLLGITFQKPR